MTSTDVEISRLLVIRSTAPAVFGARLDLIQVERHFVAFVDVGCHLERQANVLALDRLERIRWLVRTAAAAAGVRVLTGQERDFLAHLDRRFLVVEGDDAGFAEDVRATVATQQLGERADFIHRRFFSIRAGDGGGASDVPEVQARAQRAQRIGDRADDAAVARRRKIGAADHAFLRQAVGRLPLNADLARGLVADFRNQRLDQHLGTAHVEIADHRLQRPAGVAQVQVVLATHILVLSTRFVSVLIGRAGSDIMEPSLFQTVYIGAYVLTVLMLSTRAESFAVLPPVRVAATVSSTATSCSASA